MQIISKQVLYTVATVAVVTPNCVAFTSQVLTSYSPAKYHSSVSSPDIVQATNSALSAFRFPSLGEKDEVDTAFISAEETTTTFLSNVAEPVTDACILALRISTCALMIHHGLDKIQNVDGFSANVVAKFFGFLPGAPSFWTLSAAGTQVAGSALLAVGILSRPVAFSMMMTMLVAVVFHLLNTGAEGFPLAVVSQHSYNFELASMYVGVLAYFSASGAGVYSVDEKVFGGELKLYDGLLGKLFNSGDKELVEEEIVEVEKKPFSLPW